LTAATPARLDLVRSELSRGATERARVLIQPLLLSSPCNADILTLAAMIERKAGRLDVARDLMLRAVTGGGQTAAAFNILGNILGDLGQLDEAERAYRQSAERDPGLADPWINLGNLMIGKDDERAIVHLRRATRLAPRSTLAWIGLGKALRSAKQFDEAVRAFEVARRISPNHSTIPIQIGLTQVASGTPERAISTYDRAERAGLTRPELYDNRAAARIEMGDIEGARREYDMLVARTPGYAPGHRARARLYWEYGLSGDPFASYHALATAYPGDRAVWVAWLSALASFRQYEALVATADEARQAVGNDPGIAYLEAIARSETGDAARASDMFEGLRKLFDQDPEFACAYARHALRTGDARLADQLCEMALAQNTYDQLAWAYRGLAWRMLGDPRESWLVDYDTMVATVQVAPRGENITPEMFAREIAHELRALHSSQVHPADQSLRGGTQTAGALFERSGAWIARIRSAAHEATESFVNSLPQDDRHPFLRRVADRFRFVGSWSVRLKSSGYHIAHIHPQGWISSAFYFHVPPTEGGDRDAGALALGLPPAELELGLPARKIVRPEPGMLCLFPSMVWHGTIPFAGDEDRLTAAFDIVPAA